MWIPVLKSADLKGKPAQVQYWGSPVVLFRTATGSVGALADACAHRGVPLSCGTVSGESIRCGYHSFSFDVEGRCVAVPAVYGVDASFRESCRVKRYHAREAFGLVWVSVDSEAAFPLRSISESEAVFSPSFVEVEGDVRVWMDHYLDMVHCSYVHSISFCGGTDGKPAELDVRYSLADDARYPIYDGVDATYRSGAGHLRTLAHGLKHAASPAQLAWHMYAAAEGRGPMRVVGSLLSPVAQELVLSYPTRFGDMKYRILSVLNPVAPNRMFCGAVFVAEHPRSPLLRQIEKLLMPLTVHMWHFRDEDGKFLGRTTMVDESDFRLTPKDVTVRVMRKLFTRYVEEKSHLYAPDSLIHSLYPRRRGHVGEGGAHRDLPVLTTR